MERRGTPTPRNGPRVPGSRFSSWTLLSRVRLPRSSIVSKVLRLNTMKSKIKREKVRASLDDQQPIGTGKRQNFA